MFKGQRRGDSFSLKYHLVDDQDHIRFIVKQVGFGGMLPTALYVLLGQEEYQEVWASWHARPYRDKAIFDQIWPRGVSER